MTTEVLQKISVQDREKLEKYLKAFISKVPQAIVQSRCGEKYKHCTRKSSDRDVFEINIEDDPEIQEKIKVACCNINPLKEFSLCVDILLKTADGDVLMLESWCLRMIYSLQYWDPRYKVYAESEIVFSNLMVLLKSVIAITRAVPAYKLSLRQSAETYVMLYRIYPGEPVENQLGENPNINQIGEVFTPIGIITVNVTYRSKSEMTITPQKSEKEKFFVVNNDYFNFDGNVRKSNLTMKTAKRHFEQNSFPYVGAFAPCSSLPDVTFPELASLEKSFLNSSRGNLNNSENNSEANTDVKEDSLNTSKDSWCIPTNEWNPSERTYENLSCSDVDCNDFVLLDMRPSFANCNDNDLGVFFEECQSAPPLSSFTHQP
ncbi:Autophagy-related protein 13-like protein, partial [Stegodyphus mimosarum]